MSHPVFPPPVEPLTARNPFRQRSYQGGTIRPFADIRSQLPQPILPTQPDWIEMYWRAWEMAWSNLRRPKAESGFVANFIDTAFNDNTFMWDSAFMMQFGVYGRRLFPFIGTLDNFYAKQHDDGYICREINTHQGYDFFHRYDPNATGPNILAWAEWRWFRATGDEGRLAEVFWPLLALHRWNRRHRTWPSGLYWATGLSSGMDNQTRVPDSSLFHQHWTWVDASMQASVNLHVLAQMATTLGEAEMAAECAAERLRLHRLINEKLWNDEAQFYQDVAPDGRFSDVKTVGAYWGLIDKDMVPDKRLTPFIQHLRDVASFKRAHRVPSQSADSPGYDGDSGDYWRGGVWSPTNLMVLKGVRNAGQPTLAHDIALNHLGRVCTVFQQTDTFWENYAPEAPAPGAPAKPHFVGWTGLSPIAILLEDVIGICSDWPQRRVEWDRRLDCAEAYGVCGYPLGPDGVVDLVGTSDLITITTSVPVTLVVHDKTTGMDMQKAVPVGTTEIDLT